MSFRARGQKGGRSCERGTWGCDCEERQDPWLDRCSWDAGAVSARAPFRSAILGDGTSSANPRHRAGPWLGAARTKALQGRRGGRRKLGRAARGASIDGRRRGDKGGGGRGKGEGAAERGREGQASRRWENEWPSLSMAGHVLVPGTRDSGQSRHSTGDNYPYPPHLAQCRFFSRHNLPPSPTPLREAHSAHSTQPPAQPISRGFRHPRLLD